MKNLLAVVTRFAQMSQEVSSARAMQVSHTMQLRRHARKVCYQHKQHTISISIPKCAVDISHFSRINAIWSSGPSGHVTKMSVW